MNKIIPISKKARKKLRWARYPALAQVDPQASSTRAGPGVGAGDGDDVPPRPYRPATWWVSLSASGSIPSPSPHGVLVFFSGIFFLQLEWLLQIWLPYVWCVLQVFDLCTIFFGFAILVRSCRWRLLKVTMVMLIATRDELHSHVLNGLLYTWVALDHFLLLLSLLHTWVQFVGHAKIKFSWKGYLS
jgi:hypothetical protein